MRLWDEHFDCPDHSDEILHPHTCVGNLTGNLCANCKAPECECGVHWFQCSSGGCIPRHRVCDGFDDCPKTEDENWCVVNGTSLYDTEVNNGDMETFQCGSSNEYKLLNMVDDIIPDCLDASDERWTPLNQTTCLQEGFIPCHAGHPRCIPFHRLCVYDHEPSGHMRYCRDGSHLHLCDGISCNGQFKCPASYCVPVSKLCDGVQDCPGGQDEHGCVIQGGTPQPVCSPG